MLAQRSIPAGLKQRLLSVYSPESDRVSVCFTPQRLQPADVTPVPLRSLGWKVFTAFSAFSRNNGVCVSVCVWSEESANIIGGISCKATAPAPASPSSFSSGGAFPWGGSAGNVEERLLKSICQSLGARGSLLTPAVMGNIIYIYIQRKVGGCGGEEKCRFHEKTVNVERGNHFLLTSVGPFVTSKKCSSEQT